MKRANGEGTVYYNEARKRFEGQVSYTNKTTGELKRKFFSSIKSAAAVRKKMKEFSNLISKGVDIDKNKQPIGEWLEYWLNNFKKHQIRAKTFERYGVSLRCHINPYIGNKLMNEITSEMLQEHLLMLIEELELAPRTVNSVRRLLIQALNEAVDLGYMEKNPALKTKAIKTTKPIINVLTKEEAMRLINAARAHSMNSWIIIILALGTGMRIGEIFALSKKNIDLFNKKLYVEESAVKMNNGILLQREVKTVNSRREISLPDFVVAALQEYFQFLKSFALENTGHYTDKGYIIVNQFGNVRHPASFSYHTFKKKLLPAAMISSKFRFHDLRHTHATWLLNAGVNVKVVSERLGHANVRITLETYAHVIKTMQESAVQKLDLLYNNLSTDTVDNKVIDAEYCEERGQATGQAITEKSITKYETITQF